MFRSQITQKLSVPGMRLAGLRQLPTASKIALALLLLVGLMAVLAPLVATHDPLATGLTRGPAAPDATHWFGTDRQGRDVFSRLVYGASYSLVIGLAATAVALLAGSVLGAVAATANKWVAEVVMRVLDMVMSFPGIALAVMLVTVFGQSLPVLVLTIAFLYTPQLTRVIRANIIAQFGEDYVAAVRVMGASTTGILIKHVARNCLAPILVFATVLVADAIVFEASLSFIQAGVPDPEPSSGQCDGCRSPAGDVGRVVANAARWCADHHHRACAQHPGGGDDRCDGGSASQVWCGRHRSRRGDRTIRKAEES